MRESLGSEGIWTHALGGGRRRDIEDAGVDWEWRPDVMSGRPRMQSNGEHSERPERLMHWTLRTHIIIFAVVDKRRKHSYTRRHHRTIQIPVRRKPSLPHPLAEIQLHLVHPVPSDRRKPKSELRDTSSVGRKQMISLVLSGRRTGFGPQGA